MQDFATSPPLSGLRAATRRHIAATAPDLARALDAWARRYPLIRRQRVTPLALTVAAGAPFCDPAALLATARTSLWIFTLDDVFDEQIWPRPLLEERLGGYRAICHGAAVPAASDELAAALREVRQGLAEYPLFAALAAGWAAGMAATFDGMAGEDRWRQTYAAAGPTALPTLDEYLRGGRYSIGSPAHIWSAWITVDDPTTPACLAHLQAMEAEASLAIRLANDLRSRAKEATEGKVNSLVILYHQQRAAGAAPEEAEDAAVAGVRQRIRQALDHLDRLLARPATHSGRPEAICANIAHFVTDFYESHDFHTFAPPLE